MVTKEILSVITGKNVIKVWGEPIEITYGWVDKDFGRFNTTVNIFELANKAKFGHEIMGMK